MHVLDDESYMRLALQMAESAKGQTGVNPVVGCVVVKDGRIVGMGAHLRAGGPHAEVHALNMAGAEAEGGTVYVTLEPCSHHGKTPPCSDRLIADKVKRVVVAAQDPNPQVAGRGIARLRGHGIDVKVGLLQEEAVRLNEVFNKFIVSRLPFVALKTASTLDGKIASRTGDSKWITNASSRTFVHTLRHRYSAIMVGIETVLADDPSLSARLDVPALHPVRIVVDSGLRLPLQSRIVQDASIETVVLTTEKADPNKANMLKEHGVKIIPCGSGNKVDLYLAMQKLGESGINSILLEGGGRVNGAMLAEGLIDKMHLFYAPKIIGGGSQAPDNFDFAGVERMNDSITLKDIHIDMFGDNWCVTGYPDYRDFQGEGE